MALRRKENPISPQEMREKLIKSSGPLWLNSEPLFAFLPSQEGPKLFPLSNSIDQQALAVFLLDCADYSTDRTLEVIASWKERYKKLPWKPVIAFQQKYLFIKTPKFLERYRNVAQFSKIPIYFDPLGDWYDYFQVNDQPMVLFFSQGNMVFKESLLPALSKKIEAAEIQLQEVLRIDDPGLPLPNILQNQKEGLADRKVILPETLIQMGRWVPANRSLVTDDTQAALTFPFEGKNLRLVATTHPQARESSRIQIFLNNEPLPVPFHGDNVHMNEKGFSIMDITRHTGLYELISTETEVKGTIQIKFLNALENPIIVYELRVG